MYFKSLFLVYTSHIIYLVMASDDTPYNIQVISSSLDGSTSGSPEHKSANVVNIHIGKQMETPQSDLQEPTGLNMKRDAEQNSIVNHLANKANVRKLLDSDPIEPVPLEWQKNNDVEEITNNSKLDNTTEEILTVLKDMVSELAQLKTDVLAITDSLKSIDAHQDQNQEIKSYSVGLSQNHFCQHNPPREIFTEANQIYPTNCKEIKDTGSTSGIYRIQPKKSEKSFMVLCDMLTEGGGWTHLQKRYDGSQNFDLEWRDYKFGFGDLKGEFWIGLENMHLITDSEPTELLIELVDIKNVTAYAHYQQFVIGSEVNGYPLKTLKDYSGDAGDSLTYHLNYKFSTKDFDRSKNNSCAEKNKSAWWFNDCGVSNLNAKYVNTRLQKLHKTMGIHWDSFRDASQALAKSRMMVRPTVA